MDVATKSHTHYHKRSNSLSTIDKVYVACPAWLLTYAGITARVLENPVKLSDDGVSDHAPLGVAVGVKPSQPEHERAIPNFVCKTKRFKSLMATYMNHVKLDDLADVVRIDTFKDIITEVARIVRRELLEEKGAV